MKTRLVWFMFWLFWANLIFTPACTDGRQLPEEAVGTAVPTPTATSTPISPTTSLPTVTSVMTMNATATSTTDVASALSAGVSDFDPVNTTDRSPTSPTRDPGATLENLITLIREELGTRCISCLHDVMSDEFSLSFYPAGVFTQDKKYALNLLSAVFLPLEETIALSDTAVTNPLPDGITPESLYAGAQPVAAVLSSSGWGLAGSGEGLLFIVEENGRYRWAGLTVAYDNFAPLPELATVPPPTGLVYRLGDGWWQVGPSDERQPLTRYEKPLSLNPSATRALYAESGASSLLLIRFQEGDSTTIPVDGTLYHGSEAIPWLDDDMAVLVIDPSGKAVTQSSIGRLALLDILTGKITILESELCIYSHLSVSLPDTIIYGGLDGIGVWPAEQSGSFSPALLASNLSNALFSPDGTKLAGVGGSDDGRYPFAYHIFDVASQTDVSVHAFRPPGTDAVLPWGITWSPDSQWLALEPPSDDPIEGGVWLAAADGGRKMHLGIGTSHPVWLDGERLMFAATINGQTQIQLYDLMSGERFWLDTPVGAQPIQAAPDYSIYWRHWQQAEGTTTACQQLWIYESGQVKARTCLTNDTRQMKQTTLSAEQLTQLQQRINTFRTFQVSYQNGQDRLVFVGRGAEYPTGEELGSVVEFSRALTAQLGIYRELPDEETK
ncbi:MAG: hypothetical protein H6667_04080 [Ardenticatenaceae bacterium]|nr:hypothetical protein [Ardenticatenaceae bacterium]MCB9446093.1 hypothetical protein [Ardenticatenaceae bacterium]